MPLIVAPTASYDSLVSLADAEAYVVAHAVGATFLAAWGAATTSNKESALRTGTRYILGRRLRLEFLSPTVTKNIAHATVEASLRVLTSALYKDVTGPSVTQKTVGPITLRYAEDAKQGEIRIPIIDDLLRGYVLTIYSPVSLERT